MRALFLPDPYDTSIRGGDSGGETGELQEYKKKLKKKIKWQRGRHYTQSQSKQNQEDQEICEEKIWS
ncbi:hypothetical protein PsorP6_002693 [Peronosclerospora sorghi]|uniref:Uncharacterized protein n=1 Tax=Peronosclerospora sorghi TaxID=230839 RepID=A0ACC0WVX2_9STRA|nr:hypothetical protein PsorP6_002693 [Peronosclerospora sorghi]